MTKKVRVGSAVHEFTAEEYRAFLASNPTLRPEYPNPWLRRLGLRPIFGFWQQALRAVAILGVGTIMLLGMILWQSSFFGANDVSHELESYGPFCIMGQGDDELTARRMAQRDLDELVAELNLMTGQFDIVRAEIISEDWDGRLYEANVGLFGSTQLFYDHAPSMKIIAIN